MTVVVNLNCSSCGTRLERQELAAGKCVFCQSREIEDEVWELEHAAEDLLTAEQDALWR